jgi:hypothetical protein
VRVDHHARVRARPQLEVSMASEPEWRTLLDKRYRELCSVLELVYGADEEEGEQWVYMFLADMEVKIASLSGHDAHWTSDGKRNWKE